MQKAASGGLRTEVEPILGVVAENFERERGAVELFASPFKFVSGGSDSEVV